MRTMFDRKSRCGFTLLELLVTIGILFLLAGLLLPALNRANDLAGRAACQSNVRQLNFGFAAYADDHEGHTPRRSPELIWAEQLRDYGVNDKILRCRADKDRPNLAVDGDPSYVLNGFGDPGVQNWAEEDWDRFVSGPAQGRVATSAIQVPSETVIWGERMTGARGYYADLKRGPRSFLEVVESGRHGTKPLTGLSFGSDPAGGANYGFADGSVRYLKSGKAICPINLWGINGYYRTNYAVCLF